MNSAPKAFVLTALGTASGAARQRRLAAGVVLATIWVAGAGCTRSPRYSQNATLTTVEQVRQLTSEGAAAQIPAHLRATVIFSDAPVLLLLVQDSTGAIRVEGAPMAGLTLEPGLPIELTGVVTSCGVSPVVSSRSLVVSGPAGPLPEPARPDAQDLISGNLQYRYVEIEGLVTSAAVDHGGKVVLVLHALGWDISVRVRDLSFSDYRSLVDSMVRVRGALGTSFDARGVPIGVKIWARTMRDVTVVKAAPPAADVPLRPVRSILSEDRASLPQHRIRLHGAVTLGEAGLLLRDSTGAIPLRPAQAETIGTAAEAEILGFVGEERGSRAMIECTVPDLTRERGGAPPLSVLTKVEQVKTLSEDQARLGYPIHLHGVVTYHNPMAGNSFMQDTTGGVYLVFQRDEQPAMRAGDLVDIEGRSRPGNFAPVVVVTDLRVVGRQPFPAPAHLEMEQLFSGIADSTWVEAQGVVHSIGEEGGLRTLGINWGIHHFTVFIFDATRLPGSLLDSRIRLQGVCGSKLNFKRQILGINLLVPDASLIRVEGSGAPQSPPLRAIEELLQFASGSHFGERARIRGVVTLAHPRGPTYVSDSTGGVLVQDHAPAVLKVGDAVEVLGFPVAAAGRFNPVLRDAEVRELGPGRPPEPLRVTATDILDEGYDAELVQIDAVLVDRSAGKGSQALVLQAGDRLFDARIDEQRLPTLDQGSVLRVTGITSVETYESQQAVLPRSFSILMRSPADVQVLEPAPWWTASRTLRLLGLVGALALLALVWIVVLRRRVRLKTSDLRESQQRLQVVLDHIPERVFWKDLEGRFLGCNKACAEDAGISSPEEIVGKTDYEMAWRPVAELYVADDRRVIETGQAKLGYEEALIKTDGTHLWVRANKVPLYDPRGGVIGVLGVYGDITDRKRAEEKLQRYSAQLADTNEELKHFTYIVSHDLRAPLLSLRGFAAELRRSLESLRKPVEGLLPSLAEPERSAAALALEEAVPEALGFIESSVARMDHLIGALLRLSRVGYREFRIEELDSGELFAETLRTMAHQIESHKVELKVGPLPRIRSDRTAIEQVFGNLLDNAVKYLDPHRPGKVEVSAEETSEGVVFEVRDNGRGIAEEDMDKVFAPFRRAGPQDVPGEGMGLAYVRALLNRLGGRIQCESKLGAGSTFSFTLPKNG